MMKILDLVKREALKFVAFSIIVMSGGPNFLASAKPVPSREATEFFISESYTFGDDMMDFVVNEANSTAIGYMDSDYASRSLNGFQVNLDKARARFNSSMTALKSTDNIVNEAKLAIQELEGTADATILTRDKVARLVSLSTKLREFSNSFAYEWEMLSIELANLGILDKPLDLVEFKNQGLHLVPLNLILTSLGRDEPQFNLSLRISVSIYNNGDSVSGENSTQAGLFIFDVYQMYKNQQEYERQEKKLREALRLLPTVLPDESKTYNSYIQGFNKAAAIFKTEPAELASTVNKIRVEVFNRYKTLFALKVVIDNNLLSDRVRASFQNLTLADLTDHPDELAAIQTLSLQLVDARKRVDQLKRIAEKNKTMPEVFSSLEDIQDTSEAVEELLSRSREISLFQPIRAELATIRAWFGRQGNVAKMALDAGETDNLSVSMKSPVRKINLDVNKWFGREAWKRINLVAKKPKVETQKRQTASLSQNSDPLSIEYNYPGDVDISMPHHSGYPNGGGDVWTHGSDGAYIRSRNNPGNGNLGQTRRDLEDRTTRINAQYAEASLKASERADQRRNEIRSQTVPIQTSGQITDSASEVVRHIPEPSPTQIRQNTFSVDIDTRHRLMDSAYDVKLSIERARQDLLMTRDGVRINETITDPANPGGPKIPSPRVVNYRHLHGEYLKAAEAFWRANHPKEARELYNSAISIRAWFRGYATTNINHHLASFNPLYPVQTIVETLGQKFPLEIKTDKDPVNLCSEVSRVAMCNRRTAEVLELLYGYRGFFNPSRAVLDEIGKYGSDVNEDGRRVLNSGGILKYAFSHPEEWEYIGTATEQNVLSESQRLANLGRGVIAVGGGHVAPIMPGEMIRSGNNWGGRWLPMIYNSAKYEPQPHRSFYYGPINLGWTFPTGVHLFALRER